MYEQLKNAVDSGIISRKTACRTAIKVCDKPTYIALFLNQPIEKVNFVIDLDDDYINRFDGTEISMVYC